MRQNITAESLPIINSKDSKVLKTSQNNLTELLLNEKEASKFVNLSVSFLKLHRMRGDGPLFLKLGRCVRYRLSDLNDWLDKHSKKSTVA